MAKEAGLLGIFSFVLTITNIICIIGKLHFLILDKDWVFFCKFVLVMAMIILRIKEVVPTKSDDEIGMKKNLL